MKHTILPVLLAASVIGGCETPPLKLDKFTDKELNDLLQEQFIPPDDCTTPQYCEAVYPTSDGGPRHDERGRTKLGFDEETISMKWAQDDCNRRSCAGYEAQFRYRQSQIEAELARRQERRP